MKTSSQKRVSYNLFVTILFKMLFSYQLNCFLMCSFHTRNSKTWLAVLQDCLRWEFCPNNTWSNSPKIKEVIPWDYWCSRDSSAARCCSVRQGCRTDPTRSALAMSCSWRESRSRRAGCGSDTTLRETLRRTSPSETGCSCWRGLETTQNVQLLLVWSDGF